MVGSVTLARSWRIAFATSLGTSHQKTGTPCQDAADCIVLDLPDGSEALVAAVSDGAGTASRSDIGASLAVQHFITHFSDAAKARPDLTAIDRPFVDDWFDEVRDIIHARSTKDGSDVKEYACTILGVVVGSGSAVFVQLGDGAIVVPDDKSGHYAWVFWPQHGEYANSTYFVTQDGAEAMLQFRTGPAVDEVAVFSDGIERLVLDMSAKSVYSPAFRPIFEWLVGTTPDRAGAPSAALAAYLGSDHVNKRTDDDKSLVMASRAAPPTKA